MAITATPPPILAERDDYAGPPGRMRERILLILSGVSVGIGLASVAIQAHDPAAGLLPFIAWLGCAIAGSVVLDRRLPRRDSYLFPIMMACCGWGLIFIRRLAPPFGMRQVAWMIIGTAALVGIIYAPHGLRWLQRYRYLWLVGGLLLLALTILLGRNPAGQGPRLWLGLFDAYFQPSELLKVVLVVFLASYLAENRDLLMARTGWLSATARSLAPLVMMWGLSALVLVWQRDLGTATLFFVVFLGMVYVATGRAWVVLGGALMLLVVGLQAYRWFDVVRLRVDIWWNPWPEANDRAFQIVQSLLAFASGGVLGEGIGQGSPTYIPVVHSDFIFAAIGEEWGLLGTLTVIACAGILTMRALRLALRLEGRPFRSLLAAGFAITYGTQTLLILGGTVKLIPLTGVTLPFLSYGGSSLLVNFIMFGLLLVLSGDSA